VSSANKLPYLTASQSDELLKELTFKLRDTARASNWPERITNLLSVTAKSGNVMVDYPDEIASEVDYLEFGDLNDLPNAVLRPFSARITEYIDSSVGAVMANNMLMGVN